MLKYIRTHGTQTAAHKAHMKKAASTDQGVSGRENHFLPLIPWFCVIRKNIQLSFKPLSLWCLLTDQSLRLTQTPALGGGVHTEVSGVGEVRAAGLFNKAWWLISHRQGWVQSSRGSYYLSELEALGQGVTCIFTWDGKPRGNTG